MSEVTAEAAAVELLRRRSARRSLLDFTTYTMPGFEVAAHHARIADALEAVESGAIDRLMLFLPPRHTKSELASRRFPAWYLGRNSGRSIIAASYGADLAGDFGRDVRNLVRSSEYAKLFPGVALAEDSQAAGRWHTEAGGAYVAAGVGTAITGRGAHVLLIDDPLKSREEADSQLSRDRVWSWYRSTAYTRLMPGGAVVLVQTRWHDDDLAGRLLADPAGDQWHVVEMPAIDEHGAALWPEWYPVEALERIQAAIGPREWSALYQQRPQPDEGTYFKREWFKLYPPGEAPERLRYYGASDYAVTEGAGDWTEHGVIGVDVDDDIWVVDWWHGQTAADTWIERQLDLIARWSPLIWVGEAGPIRRAVEPFLRRRMLERKVYCRTDWLPSSRDKPTRARSFQARASMGKVWLPDDERGHRLLDQLLRFPAGTHDDGVDVCSLIGRLLGSMVGAMPEPEPAGPMRGIESVTMDRLWREQAKRVSRRARV